MKSAKQARSRKTQEKLISAALQIIREKGVEELKVDVLTRAANCSVGSFYNLFKDRNAIILAIMFDFKEKTMRGLGEMLSPEKHAATSQKELLSLVVDFACLAFKENHALFSISHGLSQESPEVKSVVNDIVANALELLLKVPCMAHTDPCSLETILRVIVATLDHHFFFKQEDAIPFDYIRRVLLSISENGFSKLSSLNNS